MPRKKTDIEKKTLNLRTADFDKMGEMFPKQGASFAIRSLIARFVDKHYEAPSQTKPDPDLGVELDDI